MDEKEDIIREGRKALQRLYEADPMLAVEAEQYDKAKEKLHAGLAALIENYLAKDRRLFSDDKNHVPYANDLTAEPRAEVEGYFNDLSALGFWVLAEVLELMVMCDDVVWTAESNAKTRLAAALDATEDADTAGIIGKDK